MFNDEFDELLSRISSHFTPATLVEFLDISFETLLSSDKVQEVIEENIQELKEEIGV